MADDDRHPPPPPARDVVDGIPDRSRHPRPWKYILIAVIFLAWIAVLLLLHITGQPV
ncbi:MAG: hypothetical protein ACOC7R_00285 [Planctomycetota bacterium]